MSGTPANRPGPPRIPSAPSHPPVPPLEEPMPRISRSVSSSSGVVAGVLVGLVAAGALPAAAEHEPANKVSASGSTIEVAGPQEEIVLLSETVKTSKPTDLILSVSLECSIVTNVTTVGNDTSYANGHLEVWIEIDGQPVLVSADDEDGGHVVFCNRSYQRSTSMFDDEDATIETFFDTRTANAFNWMALDVGSATHTIEVKGRLAQEASDNAEAEVVVGDRTLIVEPTKSANDEQVTQLG